MLFADGGRTVGHNKRQPKGIRDSREVFEIEVLFLMEVMIGL